jgi:hypothetical protein
MPTPANIYTSYQLRGEAEDVDDIIYNMSPHDVPFSSSLKVDKIDSRSPEWQEDSYANANKDNAIEEGASFSGEARTPTVILRNHVQTFTKHIVVSGLADAIKKYGRGDESAYQKQKAAMEIKKDIEAAFLSNNIAVSNGAGVLHKLAGLETIASVTPGHGTGGSTPTPASGNLPTVAPTDGTLRAFAETIFKGGLTQMWQNGGSPAICYLPMGLKTKLDAFEGIADRRVDVRNMKAPIIGAVDVYVWEMPVTFVPIRDQMIRSRTLFITDGKSIKRGRLRPLHTEKMGKDGDNTRNMLITDVTLKVCDRRGVMKITDLQ